MIGVFSKEKQKKYMEEVEVYFLPMIKKASYNFPSQTQAYFNIKHLLRSQLELIRNNLKWGLSVSSQDNLLKIKGKAASLSYNSKLLYGDTNNKNTSTNRIQQSNSNYSLKSINGHIQITGNNLIIKLNNKKLN